MKFNDYMLLQGFVLHWLDGKSEIVHGCDIADAFRRAGYGADALAALDYWEYFTQTD